jgi:peptide/nickel transport system substrate-binding protein
VEEPEELITIRLGHVQEPDRLEGQYFCGDCWLLWESLTSSFEGFGPNNGEFRPKLAQQIDVSGDGTTYTVHLFDGITWSDGSPFDAYYLEGYFDWVQTVTLKDWYPSVSNVVSYEALDELTFQYTLNTPNGSFYGNDNVYLEFLPLSVYGGFSEEELWEYATDTPVVTGPVKITEWVRGSYIVFDARPEYHLGKPAFDRAIYQFFSNWDAVVQALLVGEIDLIQGEIPPDYVDSLSAEPKVTLVSTFPGPIISIYFNMSDSGKQHPAILDQQVREAIDYAVDKQKVIDVALLGRGEICPMRWRCGPFRQELQDPSIQATSYDPGRAAGILDQAGYLDADGDGVRETPEGRPLTFRLQYDASFTPNITTAEMVQDALGAIGIATELEAVELGTLYAVMRTEEDFDMVVYAEETDSDPMSVHDWRYSCWTAEEDTAGNLTNYCNPAFDTLLEKVATTLGEERKQKIFELDRLFAHERPVIYLAGSYNLGAYRNDRIELEHDVHPDFGNLWSWWNILHLTVK